MTPEPLAIAALALSACSFAYTWLKDRSQNKRWDSLNLARVVVRDLEFLTWRELTGPEYAATKFGYAAPFVIAASTSGVLEGNVRVPACVAAYRKGSTFETAITGITVPDVRGAIIRRDENPGDFEFVKCYRIQFALENVGATSARKLNVYAKALNGNEVLAEFNQPSDSEYVPGERVWSVLPFATTLESPFPHQLTLHVKICFEDAHRRKHLATHAFSFDSAVGAFRRA